MITESSHYAIILRPDLSTSHKESELFYQVLAVEREVGHRVVSDDMFFLFCFCTILRKREILKWDVHGIADWDRKIIGIKVEKYKQIIPDNYFGRHAISVYDTCTAACCYGNCPEDTYSVQAGYTIFSIGDQTR